MKTTRNLLWRLVPLAGVFLVTTFACQKEQNPDTPIPLGQDPKPSPSGAIVLGKRLDNPHSLSNMRKAYENLLLSSGGRIKETEQLEATDLYVRFLPSSFNELDLLADDSTLILFDHPLDYEFEHYGTFYHDPTIPDTMPTWQYVVVPITYKFPDIYHEVIDSAFVPSNVDNLEVNGRVKTFDQNFLLQLENESFRLTGNIQDAPNQKNCPDFKPSGYIRASSIPVEGVEVVATNFLDNKKDITDAAGYYYINHEFRRSVKMHVKWQRYEFHVKDSWLNEAQYVDDDECGGWSVNFPDQSESAFHAHIFRAGYRYYYKSINGLRKPPTNDFWSERMQIRAYYENNDDSNGNHSEERRILGNWIKMYNPFRAHENIFSTTIHELAHASHWHLDHGQFDNTETKVKESWARGVQWSLTLLDYPTHRGGGTNRPEYTQVVVDMVDPNYPTSSDNANNGLWNDNVTGYTIRQIEDALVGKTSWTSWRDNIINKYDNATEANLYSLFNHWN